MREIPLPRATRDYLPDQAGARRGILAQFADTAEVYGFQPVETPAYERVELFLARSGAEIKSSLLTFHCDHEEFALRPELTAPVCRLLASGKLDHLPKPYRLYYSGSCFRYVRPGAGRLREFTQAGLELLGAAGPAAEAEVIAAAARFLAAVGLGKFTLRIGTVGIYRDLLPGEMDPEDRSAVVGQLDQLAAIRERCRQLIESGDPLLFEDLRLDRKQLAELQERSGYEGAYSIASQPDVTSQELAERLPAEAEATLRNTWAVEGLVSQKRTETLIEISRLRGSFDQVIEQARSAVANTPATHALEELVEVCRAVEQYGAADYEVVLGIARGLTFYTGAVFEFLAPNGGRIRKYGGGGRYDGLSEIFGTQPVPSVGCAFRFDALMAALDAGPARKPYQLFLVAQADGDDAHSAVRLAEALRERGVRVGVGADAPDDQLTENTAEVRDGLVQWNGQQLEPNAEALAKMLS